MNPSYLKALSLRQAMLVRYHETVLRLEESGCSALLQGLSEEFAKTEDIAAINMSVKSLALFLDEGAYLNRYELIARDLGLAGQELDREVMRQLGEFGPMRLKIDSLFQFQRCTHYASVNMGGIGARTYGSCCVILDLKHWAPFHTCFAGDSVRSCFSSGGEQVLSDAEILENFGIGEDALALSIMRHEDSWRREGLRVDSRWMRSIFESEESMVELHLHGPVQREHVREVRMLQSEHDVLSDLSASFDRSKPHLFRFDRVPYFRRILAHGINIHCPKGEDC